MLTLPYLARVLRAEKFGLLMYSMSFSAWLLMVVEYGFNLSAVREIAKINNDKNKLTNFVNDLQGAKLLLITINIVVLFLAWKISPILNKNIVFLISAFLLSSLQGLLPNWFFQGKEKMKISSLAEIGAGVSSTILIFVLIKTPNDAIWYLWIRIISTCVILLLLTKILYNDINFSFPSLDGVLLVLKNGLSMFIFRSSVSLYTTANTLILGFFVPLQQVSFYAGAEKISRATLSLINPISQAIFPRMNLLFDTDKNKAHLLGTYSLLVIGSISGIGCILTYATSPYLIRALLGNEYIESVRIVRILFLLAPLIAFSNIFGIQYLIPLGFDKVFNIIVVLGGLFNIFLGTFLAMKLGALGMALSVVLTELFITLTMLLFLLSRNLLKIKL